MNTVICFYSNKKASILKNKTKQNKKKPKKLLTINSNANFGTHFPKLTDTKAGTISFEWILFLGFGYVPRLALYS